MELNHKISSIKPREGRKRGGKIEGKNAKKTDGDWFYSNYMNMNYHYKCAHLNILKDKFSDFIQKAKSILSIKNSL